MATGELSLTQTGNSTWVDKAAERLSKYKKAAAALAGLALAASSVAACSASRENTDPRNGLAYDPAQKAVTLCYDNTKYTKSLELTAQEENNYEPYIDDYPGNNCDGATSIKLGWHCVETPEGTVIDGEEVNSVGAYVGQYDPSEPWNLDVDSYTSELSCEKLEEIHNRVNDYINQHYNKNSTNEG